MNQLHQQFSEPLLAWYDLFGRKDLPWQSPRDAYRVWVSEIMLQQTQVVTVIPYFDRFMQRFPTVAALALADEDEVLSLWSGLGYYSRARNLHRAAQLIKERLQCKFPTNLDSLINLPGIGPSTAAAILSQAFNLPTAILDGNVKRVLTRFFAISGWPEQAKIKSSLWDLANTCMPKQRCADYTQAIMDLGATCCTNKNPDCMHCPLQKNCLAFKKSEQHLYPTKKVKKAVPTHQEQFLVLGDAQGLVYLEKRPPTGLWGGLWCLPTISNDHCPLEYIANSYALQGETPEQLIAFKHKFSHFHLEIKALSIKVQTIGNNIAEPTGKWFSKECLSDLGLAKPTSIILNKLYEVRNAS